MLWSLRGREGGREGGRESVLNYSNMHTHVLTSRRSVAVPLLSTSISRVLLRKSRKILDSFSGFCNSGVPLVAIR